MKTHKKILAGLGLFVFAGLSMVVLQFARNSSVLALEPPYTIGNDFAFKQIVFNDALISGTINGQLIGFKDSNPLDTTYNFFPTNGDFCDASGVKNEGLNFSNNILTSGSKTAQGTLNLYYNQTTTVGAVATTKCVVGQTGIKVTVTLPQNSGYVWQGDGTILYNGQDSFTKGQNSPGFYYKTGGSDVCGGVDSAILFNSGSTSSAFVYDLEAGAGSSNISQYPEIASYIKVSAVGTKGGAITCQVASKTAITVSGKAPVGVFSNTGGSTEAAGGTGGGEAGETCEAKWSSPLSWIACPLFSIATGLTDKLIDLFKSQLCFRTEDSANQVIDCKTTDTSSIQPAWSAIKNIVSALLVIIMLLAIFAQAISIGPIDAYTLRKLIPRLVAAVILIQISFYLFTWVVNVVDDIGEGLFALLQTIFASSTGGVNINDFYSLLDNAKVGIGTLATANWLLLIGTIGFGIAALPALLLLVFTAVLALLVALAVLVFRKVIIIALLLIAPVALLLWVLPNTERYWKMWWDNFLKILLMFPIIVLIIEAGRIFAFVAGPASGGGFIALFIVMVGFFGPLFILPKTFRWGGTLMQMAGQGLEKAGGSLGKPGKDYLEWRKGISRWNTARAMRRGILERRAKTEFAKGLTLQGEEGFKGRLRGVRGRLNRGRLVGVSTHEGEVQTKARQSAQTEVAKVFEEELAAATNELTQVELAKFSGTDQDHVREAIALGKTMKVKDSNGRIIDYDGAAYVKSHGELAQRAALDRAVIHGQWGTVDQYYTEATKSGDANRIASAEFFKNANAAAIGENIPHVLKGHGVAINSGEAAISKMHGHEIESLLAEYSTRAAQGDTVAAQSLSGFLQRYQNAQANDTLRGNMDIRGVAAVDAYNTAATGGPEAAAAMQVINDINTGTTKRARAEASAAVSGLSPEETAVEVLKADREGNRSRYQTPGVAPEKTIPLITVPGSVGSTPPASGTLHVDH